MNVCACVNSRKGTCGGGILICQVGLIKRREGMEGTCLDLFETWRRQKKIPDEFPVRLVLPASCRTYQLSYQLGQALAGKLVTVVDAQKGLILVLLGGIIKPHVEGMLAVYAVSLEMLGWKCKGEKSNESNSEVRSKMSKFPLINVCSLARPFPGKCAQSLVWFSWLLQRGDISQQMPSLTFSLWHHCSAQW